jgi:copper chaperone CopZ
MKHLIIIFSSLFISLSSFGQMDQVYAKIDGMGCSFCANGIERAFKDMKDKRQFKIDLEKGTMNFEYASSNAVSIQDISGRIDKAGYTPVEVKITKADGSEVIWTSEKKGNADEMAYSESIITVLGNCGMCKTRIENAVNELEGIFFSYWNAETQKLHVRYDSAKISIDDIELELASIGHDTERFKAADEVYNNLHGCCKYDRNK